MALSMTGPCVLVQTGPDSLLVLLGDWHCSCTFSDPLGVPLGQPDVVAMFAGKGSSLEQRRRINQCILPCWLCSRLEH